jgi:hypothetical protein
VSIGSLTEYFTNLPQTPDRQELEDLKAAIPPLIEQVQQFQEYKRNFKDIASGFRQIVQGVADSFEKQRAQRAEAARKEDEERERQRYLDKIDAYAFDRKEREVSEDDDPLTPHAPVDPEKHTAASKAERLAETDAEPQDPNLMGEVDKPEPHPAPGTRLHPTAPQVAQIPAISLNEE